MQRRQINRHSDQIERNNAMLGLHNATENDYLALKTWLTEHQVILSSGQLSQKQQLNLPKTKNPEVNFNPITHAIQPG